MLTEPVGPRSPDDILAVVYQRTAHVRRRRRQQLTAAVAAVTFGIAGLLTLQAGDDHAQVRTVDRGNTRTEEATGEDTTPTTTETAPASAGQSTTAARPSSRRGAPVANSGGKPDPGAAPSLPTTTLPTTPDPGSDVRLLAQRADGTRDALLDQWYYDIAQGSMELDVRGDVVVFTTLYRTPDTSETRETRRLESEFDFDNQTFTVSVTETTNVLGDVELKGGPCQGCTAVFNATEGRLTMTVPLDTLNDLLADWLGPGHAIGPDSTLSLVLRTVQALSGLKADTAGEEQ